MTTTGSLRNLVQRVGGDRVNVASPVPDGTDPHSYEPSLSDVRNVVYADVAFRNYVMLEEHNIIKTLEANLDETRRTTRRDPRLGRVAEHDRRTRAR